MVKDGTYVDKDGKEKNRYHEVGTIFATPHHSNICIKMHATASGDGRMVYVFYDEGKKPNFMDKPSTKDASTGTTNDFGDMEF